MFINLKNRLWSTIDQIRNRGRLTEENIKTSLQKVRTALLEADVALPVVHDFINRVQEKSIGHKINKSFTPGQEFIKIIRDELVVAMGKESKSLNLAVQPPAVILVIGPQGSGKTTSIGKLSKFLYEKQNKKVMVVSSDIYRPAAIKQLEILAHHINVDVFSSDLYQNPIDIVAASFKEAKRKFYDVLLVDTAGYVHINRSVMEEIKKINSLIKPIETLFVVDAMIGQNAAILAKTFNNSLPLTGIILTKVDGDSRGGAALSVHHITGKPIKFLGVGEKLESLEPFNPNHIAARILGMQNLLSSIENIENKIDHQTAKKITEKLKKVDSFNLIDFLNQIQQIKNIDNGVTGLLKILPGMTHIIRTLQTKMDESKIKHIEAIINSMTIKERKNPHIIKGSRKKRIALGSGMRIQDVSQLLKQFHEVQNVMKRIKKGKVNKVIQNVKDIIPVNFFRH